MPLGVFAQNFSHKNYANKNYIIIKTKKLQKKIFVQIADTPQKQAKGLMGVEYLPENQGMLFVFNSTRSAKTASKESTPKVINFWMKNMKIPLDMLFLYKNKVVIIYKNVAICTEDPCPLYSSKIHSSESYSAKSKYEVIPVDKVLELQAGFCDKYGVKNEDKVYFY